MINTRDVLALIYFIGLTSIWLIALNFMDDMEDFELLFLVIIPTVSFSTVIFKCIGR